MTFLNELILNTSEISENSSHTCQQNKIAHLILKSVLISKVNEQNKTIIFPQNHPTHFWNAVVFQFILISPSRVKTKTFPCSNTTSTSCSLIGWSLEEKWFIRDKYIKTAHKFMGFGGWGVIKLKEKTNIITFCCIIYIVKSELVCVCYLSSDPQGLL